MISVARVSAANEKDAIERMRAAINSGEGYHLLLHNCEHFASWVVMGRRESGQVRNVLLLCAVLAVGFLLLSRSA